MQDILGLIGKIAYFIAIGLFIVLLLLIVITSIGLYYIVTVKEKGSRKDAIERIKPLWIAFLPYTVLTALVYFIAM